MPVALEEVAGHQRLPYQLLPPQPPAPGPSQRPREVAQPDLAGLREPHCPLPLLHDDVAPRLETPRQRQRTLVERPFLGGCAAARNDQRRPRLVHEDAVGLVHDGVVKPAQQEPPRPRLLAGEALELELQAAGLATEHQPVAEIVEGELLVRAVGHIAGIGGPPRPWLHPMHDGAHAEAQRLVDRPHPLGVPRGEIVVHRDDVDGDAGQRGGDRWQRGSERLALAGLHLRHEPAEERAPPEELDVVVPLADGPPSRLAYQREGAGHRLVGEALAPERLAKRVGGLAERALAEARHARALGRGQRQQPLAAGGADARAPDEGARQPRAEPVERSRTAPIHPLRVGPRGHLPIQRDATH
jgi:hypothetical protein